MWAGDLPSAIDAAAPRVCGGQVLYLDFDGVLHPEDVRVRPRGGPFVHSPAGRQLFEHAELLADMLEPYPDVRVVLSTSWVRVYRYRRTVRFLPPRLARRCIGATYHSAMHRTWFEQLPRGRQVRADVRRRAPNVWLAVDDTDEGWDGARDHLVLSDEVDGIAAPRVRNELIAALERFAT